MLITLHFACVTANVTQLYFTWRGNRYEPCDSILITDIGRHHGDTGPEDSLVCVTTDVNTQCCTDEGGVGEWFFPNGSMVPHNTGSQIVSTGHDNHQVHLNFEDRQESPTGEYTCVVPETNGSVIQTAGIKLVTCRYLNVTTYFWSGQLKQQAPINLQLWLT